MPFMRRCLKNIPACILMRIDYKCKRAVLGKRIKSALVISFAAVIVNVRAYKSK